MNSEIIAKIIEKDRIFGKLCSEAQDSYEQENPTAPRKAWSQRRVEKLINILIEKGSSVFWGLKDVLE